MKVLPGKLMARSFIMILAVVLLLSLGFAVFAAAKSVSLTLWVPFSGPDGPNMKKIVDDFNREYNDRINVKFVIVPQNQYYNTVDLAFAGRQALPNILVMHVDQLATYATRGVLAEVDPIIAKSGMSAGDFPGTVWNAAVVNGKRYAIPWDIHPLVLYWNKDLFKAAGLDPNKPPTNRKEFLEYAKKLTNPANGQWGYVVPTLWPQQFLYPTLLFQNGGQFVGKNGKIAFNSPEAIEALQFERDLIVKYKVSPPGVPQDGEVTLFRQGKNAMQFNGPWMMNAWKEAGINFGVAPVPMLGTKKQAVYANAHTFVIPAKVNDDAEMEVVGTFVRYLGENSFDWALSGQAPAYNKARETAQFKALYQQPQVAREFPYVQFVPQIPNWGQIERPLWEEINLALLGSKTPEKALNDAAEKAEKEMARH